MLHRLKQLSPSNRPGFYNQNVQRHRSVLISRVAPQVPGSHITWCKAVHDESVQVRQIVRSGAGEFGDTAGLDSVQHCFFTAYTKYNK